MHANYYVYLTRKLWNENHKRKANKQEYNTSLPRIVLQNPPNAT